MTSSIRLSNNGEEIIDSKTFPVATEDPSVCCMMAYGLGDCLCEIDEDLIKGCNSKSVFDWNVETLCSAETVYFDEGGNAIEASRMSSTVENMQCCMASMMILSEGMMPNEQLALSCLPEPNMTGY